MPSISKKRITEAIKGGKSVPGASLDEKKNLQIK
ncbi:siphovirus Gp157 family protein [Paraflavitalea speifideaquila]